MSSRASLLAEFAAAVSCGDESEMRYLWRILLKHKDVTVNDLLASVELQFCSSSVSAVIVHAPSQCCLLSRCISDGEVGHLKRAIRVGAPVIWSGVSQPIDLALEHQKWEMIPTLIKSGSPCGGKLAVFLDTLPVALHGVVCDYPSTPTDPYEEQVAKCLALLIERDDCLNGSGPVAYYGSAHTLFNGFWQGKGPRRILKRLVERGLDLEIRDPRGSVPANEVFFNLLVISGNQNDSLDLLRDLAVLGHVPDPWMVLSELADRHLMSMESSEYKVHVLALCYAFIVNKFCLWDDQFREWQIHERAYHLRHRGFVPVLGDDFVDLLRVFADVKRGEDGLFYAKKSESWVAERAALALLVAPRFEPLLERVLTIRRKAAITYDVRSWGSVLFVNLSRQTKQRVVRENQWRGKPVPRSYRDVVFALLCVSARTRCHLPLELWGLIYDQLWDGEWCPKKVAAKPSLESLLADTTKADLADAILCFGGRRCIERLDYLNITLMATKIPRLKLAAAVIALSIFNTGRAPQKLAVRAHNAIVTYFFSDIVFRPAAHDFREGDWVTVSGYVRRYGVTAYEALADGCTIHPQCRYDLRSLRTLAGAADNRWGGVDIRSLGKRFLE